MHFVLTTLFWASDLTAPSQSFAAGLPRQLSIAYKAAHSSQLPHFLAPPCWPLYDVNENGLMSSGMWYASSSSATLKMIWRLLVRCAGERGEEDEGEGEGAQLTSTTGQNVSTVCAA